MGNRSTVTVRLDDEDRVSFYSHWLGSDAFLRTRDALARQLRWDDPAYLARIIFCAIVKGEEDSETGFGIANTTRLMDNENPRLIVDILNRVVFLVPSNVCPEKVNKPPSDAWTFAMFASLTNEDIVKAVERLDE